MSAIEPTLRPYQREGIIHTINQPHAALFYDPGLGKTLTTLLSFELLRMRERLQRPRMLVVAPLLVAQTVWAAEAKKWTHTQHLKTALLWGPKKKDLLGHLEDYDVCVINYEGLKWLEDNLKGKWPWDVLVFDELSKCKDSTTQRAKRIYRIRGHFTRIWGLTGTPAPNSPMELFGQIKALDGGKALGKSFYQFREEHFYRKPFREYEWFLKDGHADIIADRISHLVHRLKASDHLDMPELIDVWHPVRLKPATMKLYKQMEEDFFFSLEDEKEVSAVSAGVKWNKLQQITQGFSYIDQDIVGPEKEVERFDSAKLDALENIIEEAAGQPVLVFYRFKADLVALKERFPTGIDTKDMPMDQLVEAWNKKAVPLLFASPQSAAHGLNLQEGGNIIVWYCLDSSNERFIQAKGRLLRQGQQASTVINHLLMVPGTIDEDIKAVLEGRESMQARMMAKWKDYVPSQRNKS